MKLSHYLKTTHRVDFQSTKKTRFKKDVTDKRKVKINYLRLCSESDMPIRVAKSRMDLLKWAEPEKYIRAGACSAQGTTMMSRRRCRLSGSDSLGNVSTFQIALSKGQEYGMGDLNFTKTRTKSEGVIIAVQF